MNDTNKTGISPRLETLFGKISFTPNERKNTRKIYYYKINRSLVRWDKFGLFLHIKKFFGKKLRNIRIIPLYASPDAPEIDIFYMHDSNFTKLSCFNISEGEKKVFWDRKKRLLKENYCITFYRNAGIFVPPVIYLDTTACEMVQRIVGKPFVRFDDIHQLDHIAFTLLCAQNKYVFGAPYLQSARKINFSNILPNRIDEQCRSIIMEGLVDQVDGKNTSIPRILVHGDIHRGSVINTQNGENFIIDFDKVIIGSAYYDFVFLKTRYKDYTIHALSRRIKSINNYYGINPALNEHLSLKLAVSAFLFDACRYINKNRWGNPEETIKKNSFTVTLIEKALRLYQEVK